LLEILVVLALIGLTAALALPWMASSVPRLQLEASARKVVAILRYARGRAVTEQTPIGVWIDARRGMVAVVPANEVGDAQAQSASPSTLGTYVLPENIRLLDSGAAARVIGFYPGGASTGGEVLLSAEKGRSLRIKVASVTGDIALGEAIR